MSAQVRSPLEVWVGIECTRNRIKDAYHDQLEFSGHVRRESDLARFAALGARVIRYPVLWERVAPHDPVLKDWSWIDRRLARLKELGMVPIAGLVHHGSGPRYTDLTSDSFCNGLADYGQAVAERFGWIDMYTPVNEPLTTARFSGLYGHWYPHGCSDRVFIRTLLNQCRAIVLCMQAIRNVNPRARLVQTEDLGKVFSTPRLDYQARFENERRWLSLDLLCGRVTGDHPLRQYLLDSGAGPAEMDWFLENTCPPDIIGLNHYVTSLRYLDEHLSDYPGWTHGGNGRERYADVEAVRALAEGLPAPDALMLEAHDRYRLPIVVTEAHLHSTREEQLRWLREIWDAASRARQAGADIRAVTAWSLLGSFDWHCLVTRCEGHYEPGAFDLRSREPRPTALAGMIRSFADGVQPEHPVLAVPGWWRRSSRLIYPTSCAAARRETFAHGACPYLAPPILIVGTGTLGAAFARVCNARGLVHTQCGRSEIDIADADSVANTLDRIRPWAVVNAAGFVRVDDAEHMPERCFRENTAGAICLAHHCAARGIQFLTFSSDLVFDGLKTFPYVETDRPGPLGTYGRSKLAAERGVLRVFPGALVIRSSAFFGPWDEYNFVTRTLCSLARREACAVASDIIVSPTYVPDLVHASLDLLIDGERGCWHLANRGSVSWAELALEVARLSGFDGAVVEPCCAGSLGLRARRPAYSVLGSERAHLMPTLADALPRFLADCDTAWLQATR